MSQAEQIQAFARLHMSVQRRLLQLDSMLVQAAENGGLLTLDEASLQDGLLNIRVEPNVLIPYLEKERKDLLVHLGAIDTKIGQIMAIING